MNGDSGNSVPGTANERGMTMLPIVMVVLAIGLGTYLMLQGGESDLKRRSHTQTLSELVTISDALVAFAAINNRLPCPDTDYDGKEQTNCTLSQKDGVVPFKTLGLNPDAVVDRWGHLLSYRVDPALTDPSTTITDAFSSPPHSTGLTVCLADEDDCQSGNQLYGPAAPDLTIGDRPTAAFVVLSHGPTGLGAILPSGQEDPGGAPGGKREKANLNGDLSDPALVTFYALPFNTGDKDGAFDPASNDAFFDDVIETLSIQELMVKADLLPNDAWALNSNDDESLKKFTKLTDTDSTIYSYRDATIGKRPGDKKNWIGFGDCSDGDPTDGCDGPVDRTVDPAKNLATCVWYDKAIAWKPGDTFRAHLRFQFAPAESDPNEMRGYGEGFTLTFVPGTRDVTQARKRDGIVTDVAICGDTRYGSNSLGYVDGTLDNIQEPRQSVYGSDYNDVKADYEAYNGVTIPPGSENAWKTEIINWPKMAIEVDTFNQAYKYRASSSTPYVFSDEAYLKKNHVAILQSAFADPAIGSGGAQNGGTTQNGIHENAPCPDTGGPFTSMTGFDLATTQNVGCTYQSLLPAWLEYVDPALLAANPNLGEAEWYVGHRGGPETSLRVEIKRDCRNVSGTCNCSLPTPTGPADGDGKATYTPTDLAAHTYMLTRVWVGCPDSTCSKNLNKDYAGRTPNMLNYCAPDPSKLDPKFAVDRVTFDTVKIGITAGFAAGTGMALSITDFIADIND